MTFPACAMHQLFVRACDLAHHGLFCSHVCACTHHSSLQHPPFGVLSSPLFGSQMEEQQNVPQPNWATWWNHSCYTGIPWLSALHCRQQLQSGACSTSTSQPLSLTQARTAQRPQVPRPARSRHPVLLYHTFWWTTLAMSVHRRGQCALCLLHTTLLQQTPPRNSPSRSFCSCVILNTPSGAQFHSVFMKTSVKHRSPAIQVTRCQPRSLMPLRSSLLPSSSSVASSWSSLARVPSPAPPCFWTQLRRLLHTVPLPLMRPPNSRSQRSFSGASTPKTLWIARSHHRHMGMSVAPHFPNRVTSPLSTVSAAPAAPAVVMFCTPVPTRAAQRYTTAATRSRKLSSPELPTWDPCESSARATLFANIHFTAVLAATCQYHPSGPTHAARSSATYKRSASTALAGTHHAIGAGPTCWTRSFPKTTGQFRTSQTCWTWSH